MPDSFQADNRDKRSLSSQLMRRAGDIIGSEKLAKLLGISPRNCYQLMSGKREANEGHISETRRLLIQHRQFTAALISDFREHEGLQFGEIETGADDET